MPSSVAVRINQGSKPLASEKTLENIKNILSNSAITQKGGSSLETSLASLKKSTVTFNEKTLRWHDNQTKLMVKGSDPRVLEATLKPEPSAVKKAVDDGMITKKKPGLGVLVGFLKEIAQNTKEILAKTGQSISMTAEDETESAARQENRDRDVKKRGKTLRGMWETLKERGKKSWLAQNWKLMLAGLAFLFAPLKWIKKLWGWAKKFWEMPMWGKILTALGLIATYLLLKKGIGMIPGLVGKGLSKIGSTAVAGKAIEGVKAVGGGLKSGLFSVLKMLPSMIGPLLAIIGVALLAWQAGKFLNKFIAPQMKKFYDKQDKKKQEKFEKTATVQKQIKSLGVKGSIIAEGSLAQKMAADMKGNKDLKRKSGWWGTESDADFTKRKGGAAMTLDEIKVKYAKQIAEQQTDKAVKITTTKTKGTTPMGPTESLTEKTTVGERIRPKETAKNDVDKWRKFGKKRRKLEGLLTGSNAKEVWNLLKDNEKSWGWVARLKPEGAAEVIKTPPRSDFKTKIPQVGLPERKEPSWSISENAEKWVPKKQTSFGDRFKNLAKFLWGDKKEKEEAPVGTEDEKSVKLAVTDYVKNRKGRGKKSADKGMRNYIRTLIGLQDEARLSLLEKKLKALDTEKVGGSSKWFRRSGFEKEKDAWVVTAPGKMHRKGMGPDSSIARAMSSEAGAVEVANERFPGTFKTGDANKLRPAQDPDDKMKTFNGAMEQNQNAKAQQASSSPIIIGGSTTNNASTKSDLNTFAQAGAHPNKTLVTSSLTAGGK